MRFVVLSSIALMTVLAGCGPSCQSACRRAYAPDECDLQVPGSDNWTEPYRDCVDQCEFGLAHPGDLGSYDPNQRNTTGASITLENEEQSAAWMDCVTEQACDRLSDGYCAPL
jgi:hypothetical protein